MPDNILLQETEGSRCSLSAPEQERWTDRMMHRREFVIQVGVGLIAPHQASAQTRHRIGFLLEGSPATSGPVVDAFRLGLRERGWIEGRDIVIEYRFAEGKPERIQENAHELVRTRVELIVAPLEPTILPARQATQSIPIVMVAAGDPVGTGLITSLARPGGNLTGLSLLSPDVAGKRLQLLREIVPTLTRVAVMWNGDNPGKSREFSETELAARALQVAVQPLALRRPAPDFRAAFATMKREGAQAVIVLGDGLTFISRSEIAALAVGHRLPSMWETRVFVETGGLIAYGPDVLDNFRRAATYVDKILKGSKPADLPVEQPTRFELVVNLKTAQSLSLRIPSALVARADTVIQ